jgi:GDP-L-fucose synthase
MKKYFVTGGAGLLGSAICELLKKSGDNFVAPRSQELNYLDRDAVLAFVQAERPTHMIHLATKVYGLKGNMNNQFLSLSYNTRINENVFSAMQGSTVRKIFFAGTVASYPFPYETLPLTESLLFSGVPHQGEYGYATSKLHAKHYLNILKSHNGIDFVYGLITNLYGPGDKFDVENGHVVPALIVKAYNASKSDQPLSIWGKPDTVRDFMYSKDAARAILASLERFSGTINIASGSPTPMRDVSDRICKIAQLKHEAVWESDKPVGIPRREIDVSSLMSLDFKSEFDLEAGLGATYEWFCANKSTARHA